MAIAIGSQIIPFELPGIDGETYSPAQYGDKEALAVIFSCNHCPYVLAYEDRMIALQKEFADQGVQFLLISANDAEKYPVDSFPKMKEHADEKGFPFPYLYDETQATASAYGAERTPEVFLFDKTGTLQYHGTIDDNYENPEAVTAQYFRDAIQSVLNGTPPPQTDTKPVGCTIKWK